MMDAKERKIRVLMLPWLAYGHIYPFLELAKKLSNTTNFYFYICSSLVNINSIKPVLSDDHKKNFEDSIEFVELHLPSLPDLPPNMHSTKNLPKHLTPLLMEAFDGSSSHFAQILKDLKPDLVIYDFFQPWVPKLASLHNIPAVNLIIVGAALISRPLHAARRTDEHDDYPFPEISVTDEIKADPSNKKLASKFYECADGSTSVILINTFREFEGKYIDFLSSFLNKRVIPVGPLVQDHPSTNHENPPPMEVQIMEWLDKKEPASVVLVSFGSEYFPTKDEREVIAHGLELSGVNFIWPVRFPQGEGMSLTLEEAFPKGFLEAANKENKGLFIEGWSPQAKILAHRSTGGILSHCGWSSVIESMKFGVPIIAMPMHMEKPVIAKLVVATGVGVEIRGNKEGNFEDAGEIAMKIKQVMVDPSGEAVRKKAKEFKEIIVKKKATEEADYNELAKELCKLCVRPHHLADYL